MITNGEIIQRNPSNEEIIRLAQECTPEQDIGDDEDYFIMLIDHLERFYRSAYAAGLVAGAERCEIAGDASRVEYDGEGCKRLAAALRDMAKEITK